MNQSSGFRAGLFGSVVVIVVAVTAAFVVLHTKDFDRGIRFALTNHFGQDVTEQTYLGRYLIVFFGFTHCVDVCPAQVAKLARVIGILREDWSLPRVQPLFITVDPRRDSAERLQTYLAGFDARFVGLTGSSDALVLARRSFGVVSIESVLKGGERTLLHSSVAYLVDTDGRLITHIAAGTNFRSVVELIREKIQ